MDISNRLIIESAGSKVFMQLTLFEARVRVSLYTRVSQKNTFSKENKNRNPPRISMGVSLTDPKGFGLE